MKNKVKAIVVCSLAAFGMAIGAQADVVSGAASGTHVLQGNFEDGTTADKFIKNNNNGRRVGTGGGGGAQRVNQSVLGFTLPTITPGDTVSATTFSFTMSPGGGDFGDPDVSGAPIGFDMVVSLMNATTLTGITAADFLEGTAAVNATLGNGIVIGQLAVGDVADNSVESFTLSGTALTQFAGLYDGAGNPSQSTVWFRLSTSAAIDTTVGANDNDRFNLSYTSPEVARSLEITTIPEPATMGLVIGTAGGVLFIRRRFMM